MRNEGAGVTVTLRDIDVGASREWRSGLVQADVTFAPPHHTCHFFWTLRVNFIIPTRDIIGD